MWQHQSFFPQNVITLALISQKLLPTLIAGFFSSPESENSPQKKNLDITHDGHN
jgi:hypothetical protein